MEVLFSPGVQCEAQPPLSFQVNPDMLRERHLKVADLQAVCRENECCSLEDFDTFLTEILAEFGKLSESGGDGYQAVTSPLDRDGKAQQSNK